jgi:hypothetical protein
MTSIWTRERCASYVNHKWVLKSRDPNLKDTVGVGYKNRTLKHRGSPQIKKNRDLFGGFVEVAIRVVVVDKCARDQDIYCPIQINLHEVYICHNLLYINALDYDQTFPLVKDKRPQYITIASLFDVSISIIHVHIQHLISCVSAANNRRANIIG